MFGTVEHFGRRTAWVVMLAAPLLTGCGKSPAPPRVQLADQSDTPEGHLKNVMRRMKYILDQAKAAPGSGVKSDRECAYELVPPEGDNGEYTANVTISTTIAIAPGLIPKPKKPAEADAATRPIGEDETKSEPTGPKVEKSVYKLAYKNRHWELVDPPQADLSETEKVCFQYALSDG